MKNILINIGANLVALSCLFVAGYLAVKGVEGWGWFLFVALLCSAQVRFK